MKKLIRTMIAIIFIVASVFIYKASNNDQILDAAKAVGKENFSSEVSSTMNYLFDVLEKNKKPQESLSEETSSGDFVKATIQRVVDGDTFELTTGEKVRIIGVNTPESTTKTEPYGKEASNYTKEILTGKTIYLQKDVSESDRYGRLLRYAWLEEPKEITKATIAKYMFNAHLLIEGYGQPFTLQPDSKYADIFIEFAREARENEKGLWKIDPDGTTKGTNF